MSGMSLDDEAKERIYRSLNSMLGGNKDESTRAFAVKELTAIADRAYDIDDVPLGDAAMKLVYRLKGFDLNSVMLPDRLESFRIDLYDLQTY